jgi:K+-sensing histidine kinase KdpD
MVVHDLKNPLQCICGSFEMLKDQFGNNLSDIQKKLFETAESGIQQIQLIIGNILGITRFEKGSLTARRESFNIKDVIHESLKIYDNVLVRIQSSVPENIRSDKDLYTRIVTNIVSNAQRFTEVNSKITIEIEFNTVEHELLTTINNKGSYINEEHRTMIFNKFVGVQKSVDNLKGQNFGLGLTFSKMAAEALGGSIWVESDLELQETAFSFTIKDFSVR